MSPALDRARAWALDQLRRARDLARRHPVRAALLPPALLAAWLLLLVPFTPSISDLRKAKSEVPTVVMSADGVVLAEFRRMNREWVPLARISRPVIDALIATEDRRFYQHHGIDLRRTAAAALNTLRGEPPGRLPPSRSSWRATCTRRRSAAPSRSPARPRRRSPR